MAHYARIENDIVTEVIVVPDDQEHRGQDFLAIDLGLGGEWIQTSYNSRFGKYIDPETGEEGDRNKVLRYTFAGIGYTYDRTADEFRPPVEP